jgi:hypothetical protein
MHHAACEAHTESIDVKKVRERGTRSCSQCVCHSGARVFSVRVLNECLHNTHTAFVRAAST